MRCNKAKRTRRTTFKAEAKTKRVKSLYKYHSTDGHTSLFVVLDNDERHAMKAGNYMLECSSLDYALKEYVGVTPSAFNHKTRGAWIKVICALIAALGVDPNERGAASKLLALPSFAHKDGGYIVSESGFYNLIREIRGHQVRE